MDFKIACALNLSPELVWFSRQSYDEELSSSSDCGPNGWPCHYGGYFPEMPHDLGSDGTQSPGRDDTDDEAENVRDDFSLRLFDLEKVIRDVHDFGDQMDDHQPASPVHCQLPLPVRPSVSPSYLPSPTSSSPDCNSLASLMETSYPSSPNLHSPSPFPELMIATSPVQMETLLTPVTVSTLRTCSPVE
ncbi:uncharacterized protein LOC119742057 [Patiria miniata]|uniref:Uncharacterized protein n=1 Tax=Patiria miniata TaxID=46514 RepID=A0A914BEZ7_PATMI|nr:uncharacterized protein LOC119742057 [Patiria miniata]